MKLFLKTILVLSFAFITQSAFAAEIKLDTERTAVGVRDEFIVNVLVSSGELLNAIEGQIRIPENSLEVIGIFDGDSIVNFWVERPRLTTKDTVTFSGITPGGFQGQNHKLFSLVVKANAKGTPSITFENLTALLHDGLGTETTLNGQDLKLSVGQVSGVIRQETITDINPPAIFTPVIDQDPTIFDGQYFLAFTTQDKESGIDRYEVREGSWGWFIEAENPHLLKNQSLTKEISVKAIDKAGNERIVKIDPQNRSNVWEEYQLLVIILLIIFLGILSKSVWRKSTK